MTQIKSAKTKERIEYYCNDTDFIYPLTKEQIVEVVAIAESEAQERHAKELQELKDKAVDRANITMAAMILDGYDPEDSCVKYMKELIEELEKLNEK